MIFDQYFSPWSVAGATRCSREFVENGRNLFSRDLVESAIEDFEPLRIRIGCRTRMNADDSFIDQADFLRASTITVEPARQDASNSVKGSDMRVKAK